MKAAVFHGPGDIRFEQVEKPTLQEGDVLIRVHACGICGSDLHTYRHGMFLDLGTPIETGRILGHEFSGEIAETGGDVPGVRVGDRVVTVGQGGLKHGSRVRELLPAEATDAAQQETDEESDLARR